MKAWSDKCSCNGFSYNKYIKVPGTYCCIPPGSTCQRKGSVIECSDGLLTHDYEQCNGKCPISTRNKMAIMSNHDFKDEGQCPRQKKFSVISENQTHGDFASYCWEGKVCPISNRSTNAMLQC